MAKKPSARVKKQALSEEQLAFGTVNYVCFGMGLALIGAGLLTLSKGSMALAPILLVLGYCVVIPIAIIFRQKVTDENKGD